MSHLLQEDVAVMQKVDGKLVFSCGAVVSPLGWSGSAKLGLDLSGIHKPVPQFNDGPALKFVTKIFERGLSEKVPLTRANWFIMHTPELSLVSQMTDQQKELNFDKVLAGSWTMSPALQHLGVTGSSCTLQNVHWQVVDLCRQLLFTLMYIR